MLQLDHIGKVYQVGELEAPILSDVNLTILRGEYVAIMGASGSGKSTLMHILGCLEPPSRGRYYFDGRDVTSLGDNERTDLRNFRIGFVFQQFNLLSRLSAMENVMLPMVYAGYPRRERQVCARRMLERVGLGERLDHLPSQLSGGQQQRVAIARALVNQPELVLADEPTGALDTRTGQEVMELISQLHQEGITIVLVTHDAAVAHRAQRLVRIEDGQLEG